MRWWWAIAERFAQWRFSRAEKARAKWLGRARRLRDRQEMARQGDLFEGGFRWPR